MHAKRSYLPTQPFVRTVVQTLVPHDLINYFLYSALISALHFKALDSPCCKVLNGEGRAKILSLAEHMFSRPNTAMQPTPSVGAFKIRPILRECSCHLSNSSSPGARISALREFGGAAPKNSPPFFLRFRQGCYS